MTNGELLDTVTNEIGLEIVHYVYDPGSKMKGILVIDTTAFGIAGGGIRMLPDLTSTEIIRLALPSPDKRLNLHYVDCGHLSYYASLLKKGKVFIRSFPYFFFSAANCSKS